jgi:hypothetical protein
VGAVFKLILHPHLNTNSIMKKEIITSQKPISEDVADSIKALLPESFWVTDFAKAVAHILADEYGEHNYETFIDELKKQLNNK